MHQPLRTTEYPDLERKLKALFKGVPFKHLTKDIQANCERVSVMYFSERRQPPSQDAIFFISETTRAMLSLARRQNIPLEVLENSYIINKEFSLNPQFTPAVQNKFITEAGNLARSIFYTTESIEWAIKWYECSMTASQNSETKDPKHAAYAFDRAADAALVLYNRTNNNNWLNQYISASKKTTQLYKQLGQTEPMLFSLRKVRKNLSNATHKAQTPEIVMELSNVSSEIIEYSDEKSPVYFEDMVHLGDAYAIKYLTTRNLKDAMRAYHIFFHAAAKESQLDISMEYQESAGRIAEKIFIATKLPSWGILTYKHGQIIFQHYEKARPLHAIATKRACSNIAKDLYKTTGKIHWLEQAQIESAEALEISIQENVNPTAKQVLLPGLLAADLYKVTKSQNWLDLAIFYHEEALENLNKPLSSEEMGPVHDKLAMLRMSRTF